MEKLKAIVHRETCLACGGCISVCPQDAIVMYSCKAVVNNDICTGCAVCINTCPIGAITWEEG